MTAPKDNTIDLDLLAKFQRGEGGDRTGALMRAGYLRVEVTREGRAALWHAPPGVDHPLDSKTLKQRLDFAEREARAWRQLARLWEERALERGGQHVNDVARSLDDGPSLDGRVVDFPADSSDE